MARSPRDPVPAWVARARYPFASRFVELPLGRMHYVDEGSGEPHLFVRGTPTRSYRRLGSLFGYESIIRGP